MVGRIQSASWRLSCAKTRKPLRTIKALGEGPRSSFHRELDKRNGSGHNWRPGLLVKDASLSLTQARTNDRLNGNKFARAKWWCVLMIKRHTEMDSPPRE